MSKNKPNWEAVNRLKDSIKRHKTYAIKNRESNWKRKRLSKRREW